MATASVALASGSAGAVTGPRVNEAKYGFSVILPSGWNQVSLNSSDVGALLGTASKADANLGIKYLLIKNLLFMISH